MRVAKRRRRENRTDYLNRLKLLKGGKPRVLFRKTNKYIISQYVTSKQAQDKIELTVNSRDLKKYGWPKEFEGGLKSIPASYLTGYLIGKEIKKQGLENPIVDFGMIRVIYKTKAYAFIKGLVDAEIDIQCKEEAFPEEDRIKGKSLKKDFSNIFGKVKSKIDSI